MTTKGKVVIKFGGGLITQKNLLKTVNTSAIKELCVMIRDIKKIGFTPIIIHGAGSYGHILAKEMKIADGLNQELKKIQRESVEVIRKDMLELNNYIVKGLNQNGLDCCVFPPSNWATGIGADFKGEISMFNRDITESIPITFGDVVNRDDTLEFGILSGDDLMLRISLEIPDVRYSIFLLGDVGGVLDSPPNNPDARILKVWSKSKDIEMSHNQDIDVTGGIKLKLDRASEISKSIEDVWFLDGRVTSRVLDLIVNGETIGTKINP